MFFLSAPPPQKKNKQTHTHTHKNAGFCRSKPETRAAPPQATRSQPPGAPRRPGCRRRWRPGPRGGWPSQRPPIFETPNSKPLTHKPTSQNNTRTRGNKQAKIRGRYQQDVREYKNMCIYIYIYTICVSLYIYIYGGMQHLYNYVYIHIFLYVSMNVSEGLEWTCSDNRPVEM